MAVQFDRTVLNIIQNIDFEPVYGTPVEARSATASFGWATSPVDGEKISIGEIEYTIVAALVDDGSPYEVVVGATDAETGSNLENAINGKAQTPAVFGKDTLPNPAVTAKYADGALVVTAKVAGEEANSIKVSGDFGTWAKATLTGGIDGTVGVAGEGRYDDMHVYLNVAKSTKSISNWKKLTLTDIVET
jgi:hypothetical protein